MSTPHPVPRIRGGSDSGRMPSSASRLCVECLVVWTVGPAFGLLFWFLFFGLLP